MVEKSGNEGDRRISVTGKVDLEISVNIVGWDTSRKKTSSSKM